MNRRIVLRRRPMGAPRPDDFELRMPDFLRECTAWVREGRLKYREDVVVGLENAPAAFIGLLEGKNFGKLMVKVGEDPTR